MNERAGSTMANWAKSESVMHLRMDSRPFFTSHRGTFCGQIVDASHAVASPAEYAPLRRFFDDAPPLCPECVRVYERFGRDQGDEREEATV